MSVKSCSWNHEQKVTGSLQSSGFSYFINRYKPQWSNLVEPVLKSQMLLQQESLESTCSHLAPSAPPIDTFTRMSVSSFKSRPCAQFAPGCKFAPGVYFWPCERCFKNLHPGANLLLPSRWCKFICIRLKICTRLQIVHMNANCIISIHFDWRFR